MLLRGGGGAARELIGKCIVPNVCSYVSRNASVSVALKWLRGGGLLAS